MAPKSWLDYRHPDYTALAPKWQYATDHYTGEVIEENAIKYLRRRTVAEAMLAYQSRVDNADYTPFFSHAIDTLSGMFFAVEDQADRRWSDESGKGLGDPEDVNSVAHRLLRDADGDGTGWTTIFKQVSIQLDYAHRTWLCVAGIDGRSTIRTVPALAVVNWEFDPNTGLMSSALVAEDVAVGGLRVQPGVETQYLEYTLDGWQRWRKDAKTKMPVQMEGPGCTGTYQYFDRYGRRILPIFPVQMPMDRQIGYQMAHKANAIYSQQSQLDHILSATTMPKLNMPGSDEQLDAAADSLAQGSSMLQDPIETTKSPHFITPPVEGAKILHDVIKEKVTAFYEAFFQQYGESAKTRTATEVKQDVAAGIGAYLQLKKAAIDDAENHALDLIAQVEFSKTRDNWFKARVQRSSDFTPIDIQSTIDMIVKQAFGNTAQVPLGKMGRKAAAKMYASLRNITVDDDEIEGEIALADAMNYLPLSPSLVLPAEAKVDLSINYLKALGILPKDAAQQKAWIDEMTAKATTPPPTPTAPVPPLQTEVVERGVVQPSVASEG